MVNLLAFPVGQIKIMQHILRNFNEFSRQSKIEYGLASDEIAAQCTFLHIIKWHRDIIRYVNELNGFLRGVMLFDFLQSSLQVASVLIQLLGVRERMFKKKRRQLNLSLFFFRQKLLL